ncbi:MAG: hypothetical protein II998_07395 [Clostridia bacterium]|nr:hypothetical protein [Clostridia bacterium]
MKSKKRKNNLNKNIDKFELKNVGSANECTGLITVPAEDENELENYMDIYDFGPPID